MFRRLFRQGRAEVLTDLDLQRSPRAMAWRTLWVMRTTPIPELRTLSMVASTFEVWRTPRAEVGSSRIRIFAPN